MTVVSGRSYGYSVSMRVGAGAIGLLALFLGACSIDAGGTGSVDDLGDAPFDAGSIVVDTTVPDAAVDSMLADTLVVDSSATDTGIVDTTVADTTVADTAPADTSVVDTATGCTVSAECAGSLVCRSDSTCTPPVSCSELHGVKPALPSGVYTLDADGVGVRAASDGYCDMVTDGGGWTLVLAYNHAAGTNPVKVAGTPPTSPTTGFSHLSNAQMRSLAPFGTVRFFCSTSLHTRQIHFKTSDANAVSYVRGNASATNTDAMWKTGFTPLTGHTANLPASTDSTPGTPFNPALDLRMTEFPFYDWGAAHWAVGALDARWECDDWASSGAFATLHQVWVR